MAIIKTDQAHYVRIAAAIRTRLGNTAAYGPQEMAAAIADVSGPACAMDSSKLRAYPFPQAQYVLTDDRHYAAIAAAIRAKNGSAAAYRPKEMAAAILAIEAEASHRVDVRLPEGKESVIDAQILCGGAQMAHGGLLTLRLTSRQAGYLLDIAPAATMGGQGINLSAYAAYDAAVDGRSKQITIERLPITDDFALDVSGGEGTAYLRMAQAANGACSVYGAQTPAAYRQPGGSVRLAFTPDAGCGIPDFAAGERAGLYTDCLTFLDYNTGQALDKASFLGRTSLISGGGAYYVQHDGIAARDVITRIEFKPL